MVILLSLVFFSSDISRTKLTQSNSRAFFGSFFENLTNSANSTDSKEGDLFLGLKDVLQLEPPDSNIIGENSLAGLSSHQIINSKVFGAIFGQEDLPEVRKEIIEYVVESGDNLWSIAGKFDISLPTLRWANNLSTKSIIKPEQKLVILPVDGIIYSVQSGDTLSEIAKTYKGDLEKIATFNNIPEDGRIYIGDIIIIPDGEMPAKKIVWAETVSKDVLLMMIPCEGKISQGRHPPPRYNAIDVANKCGTPIRAVAGGEVYQIGYSQRGGKFVKILHPGIDGIVTYYGHLSQIPTSVKVGQPVDKADTIGFMGHTGYTVPSGSAGCHLHFDVFGAKNPLRKYPVGSIIGYK